MNVCEAKCQHRLSSAAGRVFARAEWLDDTEDVSSPKLQGVVGEGRIIYIVVIAIGLGGVSFLTPNLAFGLTLHG